MKIQISIALILAVIAVALAFIPKKEEERRIPEGLKFESVIEIGGGYPVTVNDITMYVIYDFYSKKRNIEISFPKDEQADIVMGNQKRRNEIKADLEKVECLKNLKVTRSEITFLVEEKMWKEHKESILNIVSRSRK